AVAHFVENFPVAHSVRKYIAGVRARRRARRDGLNRLMPMYDTSMSRRSFLMSGLAAAANLTGAPPKRVVIAGGGIMGASVAWHLARKGAQVTLLEKSRPGAGATKDSFAWINSTFSKHPKHYYELNLAGIASWRRLEREMRAPPPIQWGGSVEW